MRTWPICIVIAVLFSGCVVRKMTIESEPSGALVYMNNAEVGRTPLTRDFIWYGTYSVQVRKDYYETIDTKTKVKAPWWQWVPFDFFAEFWPWHLTDHRHLFYRLQSASTQPADAHLMLARAEDMRAGLLSSKYTRQPTTASSQPATMPATTRASTTSP